MQKIYQFKRSLILATGALFITGVGGDMVCSHTTIKTHVCDKGCYKNVARAVYLEKKLIVRIVCRAQI